MTKVFHQEMVNYIVKPQYRPNVNIAEEQGFANLEPIVLGKECMSMITNKICEEAVVYDEVILAYGSETGTSQRFVTNLSTELDGLATAGPIPLDDLPYTLRASGGDKRKLVLVATSTFGKGGAPGSASQFLSRMQDLMSTRSVSNTSFAVFCLGQLCLQAELCFIWLRGQ